MFIVSFSVYEDVAKSLESWTSKIDVSDHLDQKQKFEKAAEEKTSLSVKVFIYSGAFEAAQQQLFAHTAHGDLSKVSD